MSSSACSGMLGSIFRPLHVGILGYESSIVARKGLLRRPEYADGDDGRRGATGRMKRPVASTPGDEWARCMGGADDVGVEDWERMWPRDEGDCVRGREGVCTVR
jgi:hypothetical protein